MAGGLRDPPGPEKDKKLSPVEWRGGSRDPLGPKANKNGLFGIDKESKNVKPHPWKNVPKWPNKP